MFSSIDVFAVSRLVLGANVVSHGCLERYEYGCGYRRGYLDCYRKSQSSGYGYPEFPQSFGIGNTNWSKALVLGIAMAT